MAPLISKSKRSKQPPSPPSELQPPSPPSALQPPSPPSELQPIPPVNPTKRRPLPPSSLNSTHNKKRKDIHGLGTTTSMDSEKRDLQQSISIQTNMGLTMAKQLFLTQGKAKNVVFSPLSFHVVLSLLAAQFKGSDLGNQLLSFLKAESTDDLNSLAYDVISRVLTDGSPADGPCLSFVNGFWVDKSFPLEPSFIEVVDDFYKAARKQVNFERDHEAVRIEANSWAEEQTKGLIKEVLPPGSVDQFTRYIFGNALYFKGVWDNEFHASQTRDYVFHLLSGRSTVKVPFMSSRVAQCVRAFDGFKVLKSRYKMANDEGRSFSMCLFLPDAIYGLPALLERACSEPGFIQRHLPHLKVEVGDFRIPRFKFTYGSFEACGEILQSLGLELPEYKIYHKSFIEVDEKGTKAAAVSFGGRGGASRGRPPPRPKPIDFVADHPFLFLIMEEKTEAVLFIGQVLNPLED